LILFKRALGETKETKGKEFPQVSSVPSRSLEAEELNHPSLRQPGRVGGIVCTICANCAGKMKPTVSAQGVFTLCAHECLLFVNTDGGL
jgi:hypothetical protein